MRFSTATRFIVLAATIIAAWLLAETSAVAQCGMCRASLAGSQNALFIKQFNIGVLVLLVPPVAIFCTLFVALRRSMVDGETSPAGTKNEQR
jgi:hypothetical protein